MMREMRVLLGFAAAGFIVEPECPGQNP